TENRFKSTPSVTRIGLDFKTPTEIGAVGGKIEMDFVGGANRDQFRIRHAYLTFDKWLIGQAWSTFVSPIEFMPETVDALGYVGGALLRTP
ncbi:DcaP family trimeric outer membrane transporter, partial [Bacillus subtilis]|uniref:DcaP family trimeric outer membrane transporter n=1 Tax=Bacillus subtilis TaxID=1423 RepID=UPI003C18A2BA